LSSAPQEPLDQIQAAAPGRATGGGELPVAVGLGLRREHAAQLLAGCADVGFLEVHAENYMNAGGAALELLERLADIYPISLHGVALSLGGMDPPDRAHLEALRALVERVRPAAVSEHLAWSAHEGIYFNDLLPIAYSRAALDRVCDHVKAVQDLIGRAILLENPARYYPLAGGELEETEFLHRLAERTGCRLLLDVNNVYISAQNLGFSAARYLQDFPVDRIGEVHLAGHESVTLQLEGRKLLDSHGAPVADPVWELYADLLARTGRLPTLIERDNDVPALDELLAELRHARRLMGAIGARRG